MKIEKNFFNNQYLFEIEKSNVFREQKGSEILSSMSKDNYASLLELENHLIDVANSVKYQFRSWQLSENREKLF
ncbi:hypothetical protein BUV99_13680, partial [Corynebacterium diphtheriae]